MSMLDVLGTGPQPVRLALPDPDDGFRISERNGLFLVSPQKSKFTWQEHERPYRSIILDQDGRVVSSGFPKFGNLGEPSYERDSERLRRALERNEPVWCTEKLDGSLCIRSVIDGEVVFRTRASFDGGPYREAMRNVAGQRYPALLDPSFEPERSLLFEFVSPRPEFRVVLSYPEDDLILLGSVEHASLRLADRDELEALAEDAKLRLVETVEVPTDLEELAAAVGAWQGREGVVARCDEGQVLVKVKSQSYLALHRIRSALTPKHVRMLCEQHEVSSVDEFAQLIYRQGGDWEIVKDCRRMVEAYLRACEQSEQMLERLKEQVAQAARRHPDRKSFATVFVPTLPKAQRPIAFSLLDGKTGEAERTLRKQLLDDAFRQIEATEPSPGLERA